MSTFYGNNSTEGAKISIRTQEFTTNRVFESRECLMDWVQDMGRSLGVVIVTKRSNKHPSGFVYRVVLMCDRGGVNMVKDSSKFSGTKKSNCSFELEGRYSKECNYWTLRVMCDEHNHPFVQYMEGHPYAKRLSEDEISLVADLTRKNVTPKDILLILKERNVNNVSTLKTIYNIRQKIRMVEQVGKSPMQVLMGILHSNGYVYEFSTNDSNELENLFFVHPISFDIWRAFPHVVIIDPRVFNYVNQNWLNKFKEMFVSVWIDQHLNFGEHTTNRVESQHAKLKRYLQFAKYSLDRFIGCIDQIVKAQLTEIKGSLEKSRIVRIHQHNLQCFKLLRGFVSNRALNLILEERRQMKNIELDSSTCGCQLRKSCGLPCACELSVYLNSSGSIPLDSIDVFWRKLDISPSTFVQNDDICCDSEIELFKEHFDKESKVVKKSLLRKLKDLISRSTTLIQQPRIQKNPRARPKKQQHKSRANPSSRDPRRYSFSTTPNVIASGSIKEPARHSSYVMDLNREPTEDNSYVLDLNEVPITDEVPIPDSSYFSHPLMAEIPYIFHPYVTHIQNVLSDGNCGFRSIAVCVGYGEDRWLNIRNQLLDELKSGYCNYFQVFNTYFNELYNSLSFFASPASSEHWMSMPETAILIANRFGVIVHCLNIRESMTCFPLWRGPEEFQHHQSLTIAHIHGNHFVMVQLQGDYPMPHITRLWTYYRTPNAAGWQTLYTPRLELYSRLRPCNSEKPFVDLTD